MMTLILAIGCIISLLALGGLVVAVIVLMQQNRRDTVSDARQGWISRRSDKDEEGW